MHTECQLDQFKIIYEDSQLIAVHKPAGLLVHPSPIDKRETQFATHMAEAILGTKVFPIHRLDRATSGLLLMALNRESARHLSKQFEQHTVEKKYLSICRGWVAKDGNIDRALQYKTDRIADARKSQPAPIQEAHTHYQCLATAEVSKTIGRFDTQRYSLVSLLPSTGRKHQLRRHLNHISHPIIGDVSYGDRHHNHFFYEWQGHHRLYLAATQLTFTHPTEEKTITLNAAVESTFEQTAFPLFGEKIYQAW